MKTATKKRRKYEVGALLTNGMQLGELKEEKGGGSLVLENLYAPTDDPNEIHVTADDRDNWMTVEEFRAQQRDAA